MKIQVMGHYINHQSLLISQIYEKNFSWSKFLIIHVLVKKKTGENIIKIKIAEKTLILI